MLIQRFLAHAHKLCYLIHGQELRIYLLKIFNGSLHQPTSFFFTISAIIIRILHIIIPLVMPHSSVSFI